MDKKKGIIVCLLLLGGLFAMSCKDDKPMSPWPSEPRKIIEHLNSWNKRELDAYERPREYKGYVVSGETVGWVSEHKRILKEMGINTSWDHKRKKYVIAGPSFPAE